MNCGAERRYTIARYQKPNRTTCFGKWRRITRGGLQKMTLLKCEMENVYRMMATIRSFRESIRWAKQSIGSYELENAALRAQLAEQEQRLAASEALLANVSQVHVGLVKLEQTTRGKIALSRLNTRRGVLEHQSTQATNMTDAYLAAVAQGWLPEPKKGATP